jgi:DNA-binding CsgD family transcriptional regulator
MSINKEAVAELVAYGIPNSQIGDAFGVTGQYIANLVREDEKVQALVQTKATDLAVRQHNNKVTEEVIEADLLTKIKEQVDTSDSLIESMKSLQLLKDIQAKGRANGHGAAAEMPGTINLNLGDAPVAVSIQRTSNSEIIKIAGRDMAPMPAKRVIELARGRKNGEEQFTDEQRAAERNGRETTVPGCDREISTDSL